MTKTEFIKIIQTEFFWWDEDRDGVEFGFENALTKYGPWEFIYFDCNDDVTLRLIDFEDEYLNYEHLSYEDAIDILRERK